MELWEAFTAEWSRQWGNRERWAEREGWALNIMLRSQLFLGCVLGKSYEHLEWEFQTLEREEGTLAHFDLPQHLFCAGSTRRRIYWASYWTPTTALWHRAYYCPIFSGEAEAHRVDNCPKLQWWKVAKPGLQPGSDWPVRTCTRTEALDASQVLHHIFTHTTHGIYYHPYVTDKNTKT